jgi:hypothetical protein
MQSPPPPDSCRLDDDAAKTRGSTFSSANYLPYCSPEHMLLIRIYNNIYPIFLPMCCGHTSSYKQPFIRCPIVFDLVDDLFGAEVPQGRKPRWSRGGLEVEPSPTGKWPWTA